MKKVFGKGREVVILCTSIYVVRSKIVFALSSAPAKHQEKVAAVQKQVALVN